MSDLDEEFEDEEFEDDESPYVRSGRVFSESSQKEKQIFGENAN